MDSKITSTRPRRAAGFTLPELVIAAGVSLLVLLVIGLLSFYASRSFVAVTNYVSMDQNSQLALDKMSREIRQARQLTGCTATSLTIQDADNKPVQFNYDPGSRELIRVSGGATNVYLTDCDSLQFTYFQRTVISNAFEAYDVAFVTNSKLIQVTWVCSSSILGAKANTESVQSAKIVLRNN